ncbi:MAG: hypothetical protein FD167_5252 [bacterium]|nr:MAG: hypothetical protein FD167_5252 [bacterium]
MKYDATIKELFQSMPIELLNRLTGIDTSKAKFLSVEFPSVSQRRTDFVMLLENSSIYQLEFQTDDDPDMVWRMLEYYFLIYKLYQIAPLQQVLYIGNKPSTINSSISLTNLDFRYQLIDIRQFSAKAMLESKSLADNLLAVLCKVDNIAETIHQILAKIIVLPKTARTKALTQLLILSGLRGWKILTLQEVKSMSLSFDIRENEFLFDIFQQGLQQEAATILERQLERKFGTLPQSAIDKIRSADASTIETWALRIFDVTSVNEIFGLP